MNICILILKASKKFLWIIQDIKLLKISKYSYLLKYLLSKFHFLTFHFYDVNHNFHIELINKKIIFPKGICCYLSFKNFFIIFLFFSKCANWFDQWTCSNSKEILDKILFLHFEWFYENYLTIFKLLQNVLPFQINSFGIFMRLFSLESYPDLFFNLVP